MASVDIDPDGVRGASSVVGGAPTAPSGATVTPPASDATSVQVASQLATQMGGLDIATTSSNLKTTDASTRLNTTAATYEDQDSVSASNLTNTSTTEAATPVSVNMPAFASPDLPNLPPVPAPAGVIPTTGQQIAELIHDGPGPSSLDDAATALENRATELDDAAATVRSGRTLTADNWTSTAADHADNRLFGIESSYTDHADRARTLASQARTHAANFRQAKAEIPEPSVFTDLTRRLNAANAANNQPGSMGRYSATIADLQMKLAEANEKATRGFSQYTAAANTSTVGALQDPVHQPGKPAGTPTGPDGNNDPATLPGTDTDTSDPLSDPALDGTTDSATQMMQTVLPAVLGGISGAVGGVLGAVSSAGQKLQEVGNQALQGVTQGAGALTSAMSAAAPKLPEGDQSTSGTPDFGGFDGGGGGGGMPGDTEPASSPAGPLSAPAATASTTAPVAAAPAAVSAPGPAAPPMGAAPMGGGMMPPMMGGPMGQRGGGPEDDRRLYPERRLHIEEQPNSEPVKGRREARSVKQEGEKK